MRSGGSSLKDSGVPTTTKPRANFQTASASPTLEAAFSQISTMYQHDRWV